MARARAEKLAADREKMNKEELEKSLKAEQDAA